MALILTSTRAVVEALGGVPVVAREFGVVENAVWNWISDDIFPARTYVAMHEMLSEVPGAAPDRLWKMAKRVTHQTEATA